MTIWNRCIDFQRLKKEFFPTWFSWRIYCIVHVPWNCCWQTLISDIVQLLTSHSCCYDVCFLSCLQYRAAFRKFAYSITKLQNHRRALIRVEPSSPTSSIRTCCAPSLGRYFPCYVHKVILTNVQSLTHIVRSKLNSYSITNISLRATGLTQKGGKVTCGCTHENDLPINQLARRNGGISRNNTL